MRLLLNRPLRLPPTTRFSHMPQVPQSAATERLESAVLAPAEQAAAAR